LPDPTRQESARPYRDRWEKTTPVAVKIKLMRMGKIRAPYYRIVVADARTKRDGRAIEQIGKYHPKQEPSLIEIDSERAQHWLSVGAQPTNPVLSLLKVTGDWQKFRGEPGSEGTLKTASARPDKKEAFAAALREVHGESTTEASKPKSRGKKSDAGAKTEKAAEQAGKTSDKAGEAGKADQDAKAGTEESTAEAKTGNAKSGGGRSTGSKRREAGRSSEKAAAADADGKDSATASDSGSGA
jgi:small subunit ribosomal protein S16